MALPKIKITSFRIALLSVVLAFVLYIADAGLGFLDGVELKSLDMRFALRGKLEQSGKTVIVDIDQKSLDELGQWPWPRSIMAKTIENLSDAATRVIGVDILFNEPEVNRTLINMKEVLRQQYPNPAVAKSSALYQEIKLLEQQETNDEKLAKAIQKAANVVLPINFYFSEKEAEKKSDNSLLSAGNIKKSTFSLILNPKEASSFHRPVGKTADTPLPMFMEAARSLGHVNTFPDSDGVLRWENLVVDYENYYYPSFALQIVKDYVGLNMETIRINFGESIDISQLGYIITDESNRMLINYLGGYKTFKYISFTDVYHNKIKPEEFKDKIVLIGTSVPGLFDEKITPTGRMPGVERHAHIIENIITGKMLSRSRWMEIFDIILALALCFLLNLFVSRFRPVIGILLTIAAFGLFFFIIQVSFSVIGLWIKLAFPVVAMSFTFGLTTFIRLQTEEKEKEEIKTIFEDYDLLDIDEQIRTLRKVPKESPGYGKACTLLGKAFMEKGLYSMAEKAFNRAIEGKELEEESKETYYMLGMLHEKQNQPDKAKEIYETISAFDSSFRDVTQRIEKLDEMKTRALALQEELAGTQPLDSEMVSAIAATAGSVIAHRYRIKKEIGKGGMGKVLLVEDMKLDELIAMKLLIPHLAQDEEQVKRFTREIKLTRKINHPNVIRVFDIGEWHGNHFITMEFIDGGNLQDWMKQHPEDMKGRIDFVVQICAGLNEAHRLNIVHRDIKPENILIEKGNIAKIVDFGIARGLGIGTRTIDGKVIGTPDFMSPEQIQGKDLDHRSDIYSLGVLMYQLFTGELPFAADSLGQILLKHMHEHPLPPNNINPQIPAYMVKIILKSMEKEPSGRFQSIEEIIREIKGN